MSDTLTVGKKLVELCRQGKADEAIATLYSPNIVSIEAASGPNMSAKTEGIEGVKGKAAWWQANHEVHKAEAEGPYPNGDRFIVHFKYDVTAKAGPWPENVSRWTKQRFTRSKTVRLFTKSFSTRCKSWRARRKRRLPLRTLSKLAF